MVEKIAGQRKTDQRLDLRKQDLQNTESVLQERQEQLFKAYDILTEKIFLFERECDTLRTRKRQLIMLESKVQQTVKDKFDEIAKMLTSHRTHSSVNNNYNISIGLNERYLEFEGRVDQLTDLVDKMIGVLFQSKGALFDKLVEQKQLLKDPQKLDASVNRAIDLAFEKRDLTNLTEDLS